MAKQHSPRFLRISEEARSRVRETPAEAVQRRLQSHEKFVLIDVREDHEWQLGHVPGARHLGRGILERDIENLLPDPQTDIVLYCGGGYRSALAADSLAKMGYLNVRSMAGGYSGWLERKFPVTVPEANKT